MRQHGERKRAGRWLKPRKMNNNMLDIKIGGEMIPTKG